MPPRTNALQGKIALITGASRGRVPVVMHDRHLSTTTALQPTRSWILPEMS